MRDYNIRAQKNQRNLQDLVHYFRYGKTSGFKASRVDEEQEWYWADLLEKLLEVKK